MIKRKFDFFVIGGGSGGVRAARVAASRGIKVGLAEGWDLGGTCVNRGCVPKKLYSYSSHFSDEFNLMSTFGWKSFKPKFSWNKLVINKKKEIKRLNEIYKGLLKNSGVEIFNDFASFEDQYTVKVGKNLIQSKLFLIAVGTKPRKLSFSAQKKIITSDDAFDLKKLPKKILILGGGYIAVEFASIFNGLGVDVTMCIRGRKILKGFDDDVIEHLSIQMKERGIKFITSSFPNEINFENKKFNVHFKGKKNLKYDLVMEALGREPNINSLKLNLAKVKRSKNDSIIVDNYFKTSNKNIYAIGDVIDRVQLTPVAIAEAMHIVNNIFNKSKKSFKYSNIPTAVFSNPNFACIGLTEGEARKKFKKIDVFTSHFKPLKYSLSKLTDKVYIKLIVNSVNDKIIGLHYLGENAAEIIQGFAVAVVKGLKKSDLDDTIGIHPTSAEEIVTMKNKN